jgi:hypothetical protein
MAKVRTWKDLKEEAEVIFEPLATVADRQHMSAASLKEWREKQSRPPKERRADA